jgi:hypothetical protein
VRTGVRHRLGLSMLPANAPAGSAFAGRPFAPAMATTACDTRP